MLTYFLNKKPVYFSTNVDSDAQTPVDFIMTEGMAMYTEQTFPCIAKLSNSIFEDISWITGHSLGGAAASLYKMVADVNSVSTIPTLVTFGALPTAPRSPSEAICFNWSKEDNCKSTPTSSVSEVEGFRYFHK